MRWSGEWYIGEREFVFYSSVKLYFLTRSSFKWSCFNKVIIKILNVIFLFYPAIQLSSLLYAINVWGSQSCILLLLPVPLTWGRSGRCAGSIWHLRECMNEQHSWNVYRVESLEGYVAFTCCEFRVPGRSSVIFLSSQVPITVVREYLVGGVQRSSGKDGIPRDGDEGKLLTEALW